jgi:hypothetical protein
MAGAAAAAPPAQPALAQGGELPRIPSGVSAHQLAVRLPAPIRMKPQLMHGPVPCIFFAISQRLAVLSCRTFTMTSRGQHSSW